VKPRELSDRYRARVARLRGLCSEVDVGIDGDSALDRLLGKQSFEIAFVGEFSAGKSTLINALLGADLLPTRLEPTTARVTRIQYSEEPRIRLVRKDSSTRDLAYSPGALHSLIASNAAGIADVSTIDVGFPSSLLEDGFVFIDTPGTNDVSEERMRITYDLLPEVDAVVYLSAFPITDSNLDSFRTHILGNHIGQTMIALNKRDLFYSQPQDKIDALVSTARQSFRELYETESGRARPIEDIPFVSADDYLSGLLDSAAGDIPESRLEEIRSVSHIDDFISVLDGYLTGSEKFDALERQYEYQYERLRLHAVEAIRIRMDSLVVPEGEFMARKDKLKKSLQAVAQQVDALKEDSGAELDALLNKLYLSFDSMSGELMDQVSLTIDSYQGESNLLMRNIEMMVRRRFEDWRIRSEAMLREIVNGIQGRVKARFGKMLAEIQASVDEFHSSELSEYSESLQKDTRVKKITDLARSRTAIQLATGIISVTLSGVIGPIFAILLPVGFIFADKRRTAEIRKIRDQVMLRLRIDSDNYKNEIRARIDGLKSEIEGEILTMIGQYADNVESQIAEVEKQKHGAAKDIEAKVAAYKAALSKIADA
jgi:hypothetical protein